MRTSFSKGSPAVIGAIALASASLAGGLIAVGETPFASAPVIFGALWVAGVILRQRWTRKVALPGLVIVAAGATFAQVAPLVPLAGLVMALVAWNLDDLEQRLSQADTVLNEQALRRTHIARLLIVAGLAIGVGAVVSTVRFEIGAIGALILGILAVLGFSRIMALLRQMAQDTR